MDRNSLFREMPDATWSDVIGYDDAWRAMAYRYGKKGFPDGWGANNEKILFTYFRRNSMLMDNAATCYAPLHVISNADKMIVKDHDEEEEDMSE